ncbi:MAG: transporter substrate-binding domain-containing protein [Deltaproteobacteria bacterium]|jgi:polar amino acid transport system substrate-binding protein|nr:transporter substrate-binding domain-containing protein [Deltaproteobacteria bacterium]
MIRIITITLIVLLWLAPAQAREKMIFSTFSNPDTPNIVLARTVISEAYNRLGMDVEVKYLPGNRALKRANSGKVDGILFHVPNLHISFPNLIQIKAPVFHSQLVGFINNNKSIKIKGWDSLNPYRVGYVRGFLLAKERLMNAQTEPVDRAENMMMMLSRNRIDVAVDTHLTGLYTLKKLGLQEIKAESPALESFSSFHYLHKKHQSLTPQVEHVLAEMEKEGATQAIRNTILKDLHEGN